MRKALFLTICIITILAFAQRANAEGLSLAIYPPIIEIQATPPSSPQAVITIQNQDSLPANLSIQIFALKQSPKNDGTVEYLDPNEASLSQVIKKRLQVIDNGRKVDSITLNPNEIRDVLLNLNLDKGDPAGDYYFSLVFLSEGVQLSDTNSSTIPAGIGTNVLVSVGPKEKPTGSIEEFKTKSFFSNGPIPFTLLLHNQSPHLVVPTGSIEIQNMLGKRIAKIKILPQYVLADSKRYLVDSAQTGTNPKVNQQVSNIKWPNPFVLWPEKFLFGFYKAEAQIQLDTNGENIKASSIFFAFPTFLYFVLFVFLFVGISIYLKVKKKI